MDLLLVTGRFPERSETFIYRKATALARRGHHVTVAVRQIGDWSLYPDPLPEGMRVEQVPLDDSLRDPRRAMSAAASTLRRLAEAPAGARRLYELCQERAGSRTETIRLFLRHLPFVDRKADLVHFEFLSLAAMYPLAREVLGSPLVVSCRGNDVHTLELRSVSERDAALECVRRADAIHCVSDEMASEIARLTGRREAVWVNRPAVETERISPRPPPSSSGPIRLLATGRLVWKKGFDYLLAALAKLARAGVEFHADILGDGELKNFMRFSIDDLQLERHVTLVGGVSSAEVLARMQSTDVFVLSSFEEGISNAVLEAMASGVPIVTTNSGGMAEAVTDGVEGFVVPVRDVSALAERIERLARDRALRLRMGHAARVRAQADFSIRRQVEIFETIYRTVSGAQA